MKVVFREHCFFFTVFQIIYQFFQFSYNFIILHINFAVWMLKFALSPANLQANYKRSNSWGSAIARAGGRGTSSEEANGDVPLDGVAFSRLG